MKKDFFDFDIIRFAERINRASRNPHAVSVVNKYTYSLLGYVKNTIAKKEDIIKAINSLNIIAFDQFHPLHSNCNILLIKLKNELKEQIGDTEDHFKILIEGKEAWNEWRNKNSNIVPYLEGKNFKDMDLIAIHLNNAFLRKSIFSYANLTGADFTESNINEANFQATRHLTPKFQIPFRIVHENGSAVPISPQVRPPRCQNHLPALWTV
jgi:hypothetical protein